MNGKEKESFNAVYPLLMRDVCASDVQDYLFEMAVLTLDDLTSMEMEKNAKKQTEMLLQWIKERSGGYSHLCNALRASHPYIVQEMENFQASGSSRGQGGHESAGQDQEHEETAENFEIVGDGNFLVAKSVNTRVHMKHKDVSGPCPS